METAPLTVLPSFTDEGHIHLHSNLIARLREAQCVSHRLAMQVCDIGAAELKSWNCNCIQKLTEEAFCTSMELD